MTYEEAKQGLARKLNIDYTKIAQNALFSGADLGDFVQGGMHTAWDRYGWTFTEKTYQLTLVSGDLTAGYLDYPATFEDESLSRLTVAGEKFHKKNFEDYIEFLAQNPTSTEKIWSEHGRFYFINMNAVSSGQEVNVTGKLRCPVLTLAADLLPFSPDTDANENSGNRAVLGLAYADALASEKKKEQGKAEAEQKKALAMLDALWAPMAARRSAEQHQDRPFFTDVPDFFQGSNTSRKTTTGNFP